MLWGLGERRCYQRSYKDTLWRLLIMLPTFWKAYKDAAELWSASGAAAAAAAAVDRGVCTPSSWWLSSSMATDCCCHNSNTTSEYRSSVVGVQSVPSLNFGYKFHHKWSRCKLDTFFRGPHCLLYTLLHSFTAQTPQWPAGLLIPVFTTWRSTLDLNRTSIRYFSNV